MAYKIASTLKQYSFMNVSKFYKKLTSAEVGSTKTHEIYIRMSNDFDYESFFQRDNIIRVKSVIEVNFLPMLSLRRIRLFVASDRDLRLYTLQTQ